MKKCALLAFLLFAGCSSFIALPEPPLAVNDPHSFANANDVRVEHLGLSLFVDFSHRTLDGTAALDIRNLDHAPELILDTRDLDVHSVRLDDGSPAAFTLGPDTPILGRALHIPLKRGTRRVIVDYSTRPTAGALQWLDPEQTSGKKYPFLFTQSESILARTWVPCQDTPSVRMTYSATVRVPVGMMALMSAENPQTRSSDGIYRFTMPQPIPSYLLALAVGDIDFHAFDSRSGVYAEPSVLDRAAWELADTPKMIDAAEQLYGPYRWGRYDILVLPPSFPYGGMENPRLTFATPTILAGDRSLVSLVAHELAHSWSGNLVTNASWNDFWLNEGFTTYFERRIDEKLYGRDFSEMMAALGLTAFHDAVAEYGENSPLTKLHLDLAGHDPDDATSDIAYEKGYSFLRFLEEKVGREKLDAFLRDYFATFAFHSMSSDRFVAYLDEHLLRDQPDLQKDVQEWAYGTGMPADTPVVVSERFNRIDEIAKAFVAGTPASAIDPKSWSAQEWLRFLGDLSPKIGRDRIAELDAAFHLTSTENLEILRSWLLLAIQNDYREAFPRLERFLTSVGRIWYITPLYKELAKTPEGLAFAKSAYAKARPLYHPVAQQAVDAILK